MMKWLKFIDHHNFPWHPRGGNNLQITRFFVKKSAYSLHENWLNLFVRSFWIIFKNIPMPQAALASFHVASSGQGVNENCWFLRFSVHISGSFQYCLIKAFYVARSYQVIMADIKGLVRGALVTLETIAFSHFWWFSSILRVGFSTSI